MDRPPPPSLTEHAVDGLVFNSSFDHANLKVQKEPGTAPGT